MNKINSSQIEYVLFHLKQHVVWDDSWPLIYLSSENLEPFKYENSIVFVASESEEISDKRVGFMGSEIPVLFAHATQDKLFELDDYGNVIFYQDLLKSAFYILSGYQELQLECRDHFDRYSYECSVQKKLDCVQLPVVNYYFEMIIQGLELFAQHHKQPLARKRLFEECGFFLSHDVDRVAFYHFKEVAFKLKQLLKLSPLTYSYKVTLKLFIKGVFHLLWPFKKKDPWWNFTELMEMEKMNNIRSTFFFLKSLHENRDSRYQFSDKKIKDLIHDLVKNGFEVGLHGSFDSANNFSLLQQQADELKQVLGAHPEGIRQHFLRFYHPDTLIHQHNAGLKYDSTLGFAEHDGYRNGYCYPFRPFDFEKNQMMDYWEIPLVMMEVSVLNYRNESLQELRNSAFHHLEEAKKFGGLFSLLWHNCRLMDEEFAGVEQFYPQLLKEIVEHGAVSMTGKEIVEKISLH